MNPLNLVIELSDLLESTGYEGEPIAQLFDEEIFPAIRQLREKADPIGLGDRFGKVLDKVQASLNAHGTDRVRTLKDMMKSSLITYVRATHDAVTAREMYHRAIMSGSDTMLTVTAATILANALSGQHQDEAKMLIQQVASRLSGKQPRIPSMESASGAAVGSGAIAVAAKGMKKKIRRRDSIFAEDVTKLGRRTEPVKNPRMGDPDNDLSNVHRLPHKGNIIHGGRRHAPPPEEGEGGIVYNVKLPNFMYRNRKPIDEGDVTAFPGSGREIQNPASTDPGNDMSNVQMLRPTIAKPNKMKLADLTQRVMPFQTARQLLKDNGWEEVAHKPVEGTRLIMVRYDHPDHPPLWLYSNGAWSHRSRDQEGDGITTLEPYLRELSARSNNQNVIPFGENVNWDDLIGNPTILDVLREISEQGNSRPYDGVMVDPVTAELVLNVHQSLTKPNQQRYESKSLTEMIKIAHRAVERGLIEVVMQEG